MIALKPDGSTVFCYGDDLPAGAVRVNPDSTLYTPPAPVVPAPIAPTLGTVPNADLQAAMMRAAAAAAKTVAKLEPVLKKKYGLNFWGGPKK